jgi:hypothetical protein
MAQTMHVLRYTGRRTRNRLSSLGNQRKVATFHVQAAISDDFWRTRQSSVQWAEKRGVLDQSTVTYHGPCHSLLHTDGSNMARPALYKPIAAKSAKFTRKPAKASDVPCSENDYGRFLESAPNFSLVAQSIRRTGPKCSDTPWTLPLIAAYRWLKHGMSTLKKPTAVENQRKLATFHVQAAISDNFWKTGQSSV